MLLNQENVILWQRYMIPKASLHSPNVPSNFVFEKWSELFFQVWSSLSTSVNGEKWQSFCWQAYFTCLSDILINLGHFKADVFLFAFEQENLKSSMMGTEQKNVNYHISIECTSYKYVVIKDETWYINESSLWFIKTVIFTQHSSLLTKI